MAPHLGRLDHIMNSTDPVIIGQIEVPFVTVDLPALESDWCPQCVLATVYLYSLSLSIISCKRVRVRGSPSLNVVFSGCAGTAVGNTVQTNTIGRL